jgi:hypothetical protein
MRFRYKPLRAKGPVVSLGGRQERPRPIVRVSLLGPAGTRVIPAGVDSYADDTVFPEVEAVRAGIDLTHAPLGTSAGIGQAPVPVKYAQVTLRLTDGREFHEWPAWVGFTPALTSYALLGFAGCLQFFDTTFYGALEEVELKVNPLYPGT